MWKVLLPVLFACGTGVASQDEVLGQRREYNQASASIDTLMRQYGSAQLERLSKARTTAGLMPADMDLVLIFWADDEAEIFLNGYLVSDTRLTPTQVEIPSLYLRQQNLLRAHCWDTDRVESGFMAGLYLRDGQGRLYQVLASGERRWKAGEVPAQEIYYTHQQPDIPGAQVIWGERLFGEVWLEVGFASSSLHRAARRRPLEAAVLNPQERPMQTHEVVGRLVRLQERRRELERELARHRRNSATQVRYRGYVTRQLAFTLRRASPLVESQSIAASTQLHEWAMGLPEVHKKLVFQERRELKGTRAATPSRAYEDGGAGEADRRADYQAPPERGPGAEQEHAGRGRAAGSGRSGVAAVVVRGGAQWGLLGTIAGLALYVGLAGRQWWRLFNGKVW